MFWALALVSEEYFVPALNVLCEVYKIPDDVAGATLMAAGASSPELFTSFIALIVYQSNLGVGTVVGSEIFNHMIISAGSVLFADKGVLVLDARIIARDLIAYMLSLFLLMYALKDHMGRAVKHAFDESQWETCLDVTLAHGGVLLLAYVLYAVVCGNFQKICRFLCPRGPEEEPAVDPKEAAKAALHMNNDENDPLLIAPYAPRASFTTGPLYQWESDADRAYPGAPVGAGGGRADMHEISSALHGQPVNTGLRRRSSATKTSADTNVVASPMTQGTETSAATGGKGTSFEHHSEKEEPTDRTVTTMPMDLRPSAAFKLLLDIIGISPPTELTVMYTNEKVMHCYLYEYSDVIKMPTIGKWETWHLRHFTIDHYGVHSRSNPDEAKTGPHVEIVDLSNCTGVVQLNKAMLEFSVTFSNAPQMKFRAPSPEIMDAFMQRVSTKLKIVEKMSNEKKQDASLVAQYVLLYYLSILLTVVYCDC